MANDKDFIVKNAVEVGGSVKTTLGTVTSNVQQTSYDISNAVNTTSFSLASQDTQPSGISFKSDGTKMYVAGMATDSIYQYSLSTAWDVSTASYDSVSLSVSSQDTTPTGLYFKSDGTKFFLVGNANDTIYQYSLTTAWDLSTASYDSKSVSVTSQASNPYGVTFKPDGTSMYVSGAVSDAVFEYTLTTAWDVSTASYASKTFDLSNEDAGTLTVHFNDDGTEMYMMGTNTDRFHKYDLSTAYDVSTATFVESGASFGSLDAAPVGSSFGDSGKKLYVTAINTDKVYQFTTATYAEQINLDTGNYFNDTLAVNTTYTFSNAGDVQSFQLEVTGASTYTITWPSSIQWSAGEAPSAPASGETDIYSFITPDNGTTYYGFKVADNLS